MNPTRMAEKPMFPTHRSNPSDGEPDAVKVARPVRRGGMAQTSRSSPAIGGAVPTQCIERAKELADRSNEDLMSTLEETSALSRSAMWELRHPMEIGEIF